MCDNIASNGLLGIHTTESCVVDLRNDLIRYYHSHTKLISETHKSAQELGQVRLTRRQFATSRKIGAI
jgi:hypothetical protein